VSVKTLEINQHILKAYLEEVVSKHLEVPRRCDLVDLFLVLFTSLPLFK